MKTICLLSYWVMLFSSITFGQDVQPPKQDQRFDLLKRIWKVGLLPTNPTLPQSSPRITGYQFTFANMAKRSDKQKLEERAANAILVMTMIGTIDSSATDSLDIAFYGPGATKPVLDKRFGLAAVIAKYKTTAQMVTALFDLCPFTYNLHQQRNIIEASINPTDDLYGPSSDCGYIGLGYSLIITKFFDHMQGSIQEIKWNWSDPFGHQIPQVFKANDQSYLALESSFL